MPQWSYEARASCGPSLQLSFILICETFCRIIVEIRIIHVKEPTRCLALQMCSYVATVEVTSAGRAVREAVGTVPLPTPVRGGRCQ